MTGRTTFPALEAGRVGFERAARTGGPLGLPPVDHLNDLGKAFLRIVGGGPVKGHGFDFSSDGGCDRGRGGRVPTRGGEADVFEAQIRQVGEEPILEGLTLEGQLLRPNRAGGGNPQLSIAEALGAGVGCDQRTRDLTPDLQDRQELLGFAPILGLLQLLKDVVHRFRTCHLSRTSAGASPKLFGGPLPVVRIEASSAKDRGRAGCCPPRWLGHRGGVLPIGQRSDVR